jgi:hypothetical protein
MSIFNIIKGKEDLQMTIYSRRKFLKTAVTGAAGLTIVPNSILGKSFGHTASSDKLNIAGIGVGENAQYLNYLYATDQANHI